MNNPVLPREMQALAMFAYSTKKDKKGVDEIMTL